jgi:hypothetical protein
MPASGVNANLTAAQITRSYSSDKPEIMFSHEDAKHSFVFERFICRFVSRFVFGALFTEV